MEGFQEVESVPGFSSRHAQPQSHNHPLDDETLSMNMWKIMSHDLRGSLISIMATLKLLGRGYYGRMDEGVENQVKELLGRVAQLIGISEECLGRALSADGHLEIRQEVLDLRKDVIHPVLEELSSEIKNHHMRIDNRLERVPVHRIPIRANRLWLKTVFRNLLKNAIQYGDAGGTISFGFEILGSFYRLNVYNSGKPIPERWRDKLFIRVSHMKTNGNHNTRGMGIGVYLIKRIIQKLGGNIRYEAKKHGSNFVLTLPIETH